MQVCFQILTEAKIPKPNFNVPYLGKYYSSNQKVRQHLSSLLSPHKSIGKPYHSSLQNTSPTCPCLCHPTLLQHPSPRLQCPPKWSHQIPLASSTSFFTVFRVILIKLKCLSPSLVPHFPYNKIFVVTYCIIILLIQLSSSSVQSQWVLSVAVMQFLSSLHAFTQIVLFA